MNRPYCFRSVERAKIFGGVRLAVSLYISQIQIFEGAIGPGRPAAAVQCPAAPVVTTAAARPGGHALPRKLSSQTVQALILTGCVRTSGLWGQRKHILPVTQIYTDIDSIVTAIQTQGSWYALPGLFTSVWETAVNKQHWWAKTWLL